MRIVLEIWGFVKLLIDIWILNDGKDIFNGSWNHTSIGALSTFDSVSLSAL